MIILASKSPRRQELLRLTGLPFEVRTADVDETMDPGKDPAEEVLRVGARKAAAVAAVSGEDDVIVAADTIVVADGRIYGKPKDEADAVRMLRELSGREHEVMTGLTVRRGERTESRTVITRVRFRELSDEEIRAYVATGIPMDKAGAYGIQDYGALFVEHLDGDYYCVMGLPVCTLGQMLRRAGISILTE